MDEQTLVIVGNGMMSWKLCKKLVECRACPESLRIVVFGEEPRPAYDRIHLTELFSGKTPEDLCLAPERWYAENGIELHLGDPVVAVDRDECLVRSRRGVVALYDRLVFATGSRPFVPKVPGADLPGVFVYRTVEDLAALRAYAGERARAAVIGGGLLGLEAARAVHDLGLEVHVFEASPRLLPRQLDAAGARLLEEKIEALGMRVHTGARTARIEGDGGERVLCFEDGRRHETEVVVLSAGVRPRGELARAAGLEVTEGGGVVVDDRLRSSDPRVFAVGECASHRGVVYGMALPGYRMIDVLVDNLVGGDAAFEGADPTAKLKLLGVTVASIGRHDERATPGASVHVYAAHGVYRKLVMCDGRIAGAVVVGEWDDLDRVHEAVAEPRRISFWDMRRFRGTGSLWLKSESPPVHEWPAEALVCGCLGVRRGALTEAELAGCATAEELSMITGAGTMCGSCRPLLADFIHRQRADSLPPSRLDPASPPDEPPPTLRCSGLPAPPSSRRLAAAHVNSARAALRADAAERRVADTMATPPGPSEARSDAPLPARRASITLSSAATLRLSDRAPALDSPHESARRPRLPAAPEVVLESILRPSPMLRGTPPQPLPREGLGSESEAEVDDGRLKLPSSHRLEPMPPSSHRLEPMPPSSHRLEAMPPSSRRRDSMPPLRPISVPPGPLSTVPPGRLPPPSLAGVDPAKASPLLAAGAAALLGSLAISLSPALPPSPSIRGLHLDALSADRSFKLASGYAMVALILVGLLLSLRKRWPRFSRGAVASYRLLHAALGGVLLLVLALHTGLRPGEHLNRVLLIDVLALSLLGGVAAVVTAVGHRFFPAAVHDRRLLSYRAHILLFLPVPALIALHALSAHYY